MNAAAAGINGPVLLKLEYLQNVDGLRVYRLMQHPVAVWRP